MGKIISSLNAKENVAHHHEKTARHSKQYTRIKVMLEMLSWSYREPLVLYRHLADCFGEDAVYLLEAVEEPGREARYAYIGFDPLLHVRFRERTLDIDGKEQVSATIGERLVNAGLVCRNSNHFFLEGESKPWDVLRFIGQAFDIEPRPEVGQFAFGWFGYFAYDAIRYIESLPERMPRKDSSPDIELTLYRGVVCCDRTLETVRVILAHQSSLWADLPVPCEPKQSDETDVILSCKEEREIEMDSLHGTMHRDAYLAAVDIAKEHILRGDIYQIQIGHAIHVCSKTPPFNVYRRLRSRNPSPFMYYAPIADGYIIGASPELHVRVTASTVMMRPIAGTAPRSKNPEEDQRSIERMCRSEKEIAEHIMLVDYNAPRKLDSVIRWNPTLSIREG